MLQQIDPSDYAAQLAGKQREMEALFAPFDPPPLEVFDSAPLHFRMRAEFRIWHEGKRAHYAMMAPGERTPRPIDSFAIGSTAMVNAMTPLLDAINGSELLRLKLYGCEFLTTSRNQVLVTLIYHKPLDDTWHQHASDMAAALGIGIIGRSRKQKRVTGEDFVTEYLEVDGKTYSYQQVESGFTQPNARVNERMLSWAKDVTAASNDEDLLELYCGNGNFTVVLAANFRRVLATEVAKISVQSAQVNLEANGVDNVVIARMSSEEISEALAGKRAFFRLRDVDLDSYRFSTLFLDPPRAGLDDATLRLAAKFNKILYISCNPLTLKENMNFLHNTHEIRRFALFDQFPYTHHIECGVWLCARNSVI
ncbi:MAG: tRNA (uridine(54)-C5)-methyltransferase TrmA [Porticoccaceae bacterium]